MAATNPQNRVLDRKASSKEPKVRNGSMTYNKMNERDMERMIDRIMKRVNATKTTKAPLNETEASSIKWAKQVREIRATKEESPLNKKIVDEKTKILFNEVQKSKNQNKPGFYEKNENARAGLKNLITKTHPHFKRFNHPQLLLATDHSKYERLIDLISVEEDKENSVENTERKNEVIGELFYFLVEEYNKKGDLLTAEQKVHLATIMVDQVTEEDIEKDGLEREKEIKAIKRQEAERLENLIGESFIPFPFGLVLSLSNSRNYRSVDGLEIDDLDREWEENKKKLDKELQKEKSLRSFYAFQRFDDTSSDLKNILESYEAPEIFTEESLENYEPNFATYNDIRLLPQSERDEKYWQLIGFIQDPESREEYFNREIVKMDLAIELYSYLVMLSKGKGAKLSDDQKIQLAALVLNQTTDADVQWVKFERKKEQKNVEFLEKKRYRDMIGEAFLPFPLNLFIAASKLTSAK